jgi:predicted dinucleotide-utilizing enzyme
LCQLGRQIDESQSTVRLQEGFVGVQHRRSPSLTQRIHCIIGRIGRLADERLRSRTVPQASSETASDQCRKVVRQLF